MALSSLTPDSEPRGKNGAGGGDPLPAPTLLHSEKVSQNALPLEFLTACCLKLLESPMDKSPMMLSSISSSNGKLLVKLGDERALVTDDRSKLVELSGPTSLSRTCLTTSASRRVSASAGAPSSMSAARIRAKFLDLGYEVG